MYVDPNGLAGGKPYHMRNNPPPGYTDLPMGSISGSFIYIDEYHDMERWNVGVNWAYDRYAHGRNAIKP